MVVPEYRFFRMDEYKASVQGVDDALARLNATLASYKTLNLNAEHSQVSQRELTQKSHVPQSSQVKPLDHDPASVSFRTFQVISKVSGTPGDYRSWWATSSEGSSHRYGQVCSAIALKASLRTHMSY